MVAEATEGLPYALMCGREATEGLPYALICGREATEGLPYAGIGGRCLFVAAASLADGPVPRPVARAPSPAFGRRDSVAYPLTTLFPGGTTLRVSRTSGAWAATKR